MLVVGERSEKLLKSKFVHSWVNYVLVVDKSALEMKIDEFIADRVWDDNERREEQEYNNKYIHVLDTMYTDYDNA